MSVPTVTNNGSAVTAQGWQIESGVGTGIFNSVNLPYTVSFGDNGKKLRYLAINGCGTTIGNEVIITVNNKPTISTITAPAALCADNNLEMSVPTVTNNGSAVTVQGWQIESGVGTGIFNNVTLPYTVSFGDNGKKLRYHTMNECGTTNGNEVIITVIPNITQPNPIPETICSGETATINTPLLLTGTVVPDNATYQNIEWVLVNAGTTGASISSGNMFFAHSEGTALIEAKIANGICIGNLYEQPFPIRVGGVGIEELQINNYELRVYPNPTTGELTIENGELTIENVEIFDVYGRTVSSHHHIITSSNHLIINISHLSTGIYFLKVHTDKGLLFGKVVKE